MRLESIQFPKLTVGIIPQFSSSFWHESMDKQISDTRIIDFNICMFFIMINEIFKVIRGAYYHCFYASLKGMF
tara:strand:- start:734 stop:952 length:219 start_codon:yes stop_codon:yes gene_type:complete